MFRKGDSVLVYHMHPFLSIGCSLNKVPLSSINKIMNFVGKEDELHDMVGNITHTSFSKSDPPSHVEKFGLSTSLSGVHIIKEKLEVRKFRRFMKYCKAKIFPKGCTSLDTQDGGEVSLSGRATVVGEDNLGLDKVNLLPKMGAKLLRVRMMVLQDVVSALAKRVRFFVKKR